MSEKEHIETLFAYHWHTNRRLLDLTLGLDPAAHKADFGKGRRTIYDLFFHLYVAMRGWRVGLSAGAQPPAPEAADTPDMQSLNRAFNTEMAAWQALLGSLTDESIAESVELTNLRGDVWSLPRWRVLHHLILHGMQHHTELAQLLTEQGASPGDIDFIYYR